MKIKVTYIGILNGVAGVWCGFKPEGAKIKEERYLLYPKEGFVLERISDKKHFDSVWLKDNDTEENYIEVEYKDNKRL